MTNGPEWGSINGDICAFFVKPIALRGLRRTARSLQMNRTMRTTCAASWLSSAAASGLGPRVLVQRTRVGSALTTPIRMLPAARTEGIRGRCQRRLKI